MLVKSGGLKQPFFEELNNQFRLTLYSIPIEPSRARPGEELSIKYLKKNKEISTHSAAEFWNISPRAARTRLKRLLDKGVVHRIATPPKDPYAVYTLAR